jgi:hypothetical protein
MARQQVQPTGEETGVTEAQEFNTEGDEAPAGVMFENNQEGLVVDLAGVEEFKYELLPKGKYTVIVEDNEFAYSKASGKPMWSLRLNVIDEEYRNRKLFTIFSFAEKALPGTKAALAVLAPELLSQPFRVDDPEVVTSIIGKYGKVQVAIEKQEGYDEQNRVKRWFQPDNASAFL